MNQATNVEFISQYLKNNGMNLENTKVIRDDLIIYANDYFSPRSWESGKYDIIENANAVHYFAGTWYSLSERILSMCYSNRAIVKIGS